MAADVDHVHCGWSHEELSDRDDSQEVSASQMLDHGSISFGRFEAETLSWEKWSVFTHNRCQEELEQFNGLVAQKKAYFEEYYRKIRALKASTANQQTELTLDYGGDGSISSQTGEEDETSSLHGSLRDKKSNNVNAALEGPISQKTFDQGMNCSGSLQLENMGLESTLVNIDSSPRSSEKLEADKRSSKALQVQHLDTESLSLSRSTEEIEQNDLSSIDAKEILRKHESPMLTVVPGEASHRTLSDPTNSGAGDSHHRPDFNLKTDKVKVVMGKSLHGTSVPKDLASSLRTGLKPKSKSKSDIIQASQGSKYQPQKAIGSTGHSAASKGTSNRVSGQNRSASVTSRRTSTEVRTSNTITRPSSLATGGRTGIRQHASRLASKTSNKLASSLNLAKGGLSIQGTSKKTAINNGVKSSLESKRDHKDKPSKTLVLDRHSTSSKGRELHVLGPPNSRSINLPARNKSSCYDETGFQFTNSVVRNRHREGKEDQRLKEPRGVTEKVAPRPTTRTPRSGSKKVLPSQTAVQSPGSSKPQADSSSLNGRKPKREMPQWR